MTYGSLFTGIGGLDLGLDRAGFECKWQVEIDPYALKVLERHWPHVTRYGDITKLSGDELEPVDLMCGGFPCQDLSQAGKQAGIEGTRSGLWFEFARLVWRLRPRYVLVENVPGLLISAAMRRVIGELARCGYVGSWRSLRASEFGASHLRKRVFIVAHSSEGTGSLLNARAWNGRQDPGGRSNNLGNSQRTRWTQTGTGRHEHAGPEPEEGSGILGQFAPGPSDPRWPYILRERPDLAPALVHGKRKSVRDVRGRCGDEEEPNGTLGEIRGISGMHLGEPGIGDGSERGTAPPQSQVCRMVDGIPPSMDGDPMSNRTKRLGRLGNAVVPQISEWIGNRIMEFDSSYA